MIESSFSAVDCFFLGLPLAILESMDQTNSYITQFAQIANAEGKLDAEVFSDMGIKHWSMDKGKEISYQKDDSHTLSIYLKGGETNYRTDVTSSKGAPGKICLMPQGQSSQWQINEKVEFVHLYFSDALLKRYASTSFGVDVRFIELSDLLFKEDLMLKQLFKDKTPDRLNQWLDNVWSGKVEYTKDLNSWLTK